MTARTLGTLLASEADRHGACAGSLLWPCTVVSSFLLVSVILFACGHRPRRREDGGENVKYYGSGAGGVSAAAGKKDGRVASAAAGIAVGAGVGVAAAAAVAEGNRDRLSGTAGGVAPTGDAGSGSGVGCCGCGGGDGGGCGGACGGGCDGGCAGGCGA